MTALLMVAGVGAILLVVVGGYVQLRALASMERVATRALASEKTWAPDKELGGEAPEPLSMETDLDVWEAEQERLRRMEAHILGDG